jgi:hypothetical protein
LSAKAVLTDHAGAGSREPGRGVSKDHQEIIRQMSDERLYRRPAAEIVRSFLMLRFGLHLGLRQKKLRQLMVCERGRLPRSERQLADMKRGGIRWNERDNGWEVLILLICGTS